MEKQVLSTFPSIWNQQKQAPESWTTHDSWAGLTRISIQHIYVLLFYSPH